MRARACALALLLCCCSWTLAGRVQAETLELFPDQSQIRFELDSTLHRVEGTARLVSGEIRFSPEGGVASGSVVVDARSLETGNRLRDRGMHAKVLESERYPRIELLPENLEVGAPEDGVSAVVLSGTLQIHGGEWPLTLRAQVTLDADQAHVQGHFVIPYVVWGMRDMSNFLLKVDKEVRVEIDATGRILHGPAAQPTPPTERLTPSGAPG